MEKITILMPCLNEEKAIVGVLKEIPKKELEEMNYEVEILLIDGKSTDRTVELALENKAKILVAPKRGYGAQYKYGFFKAEGDIVATADSDGTYPLDEIPKLVKMLKDENLDFINANRFGEMEKEAMEWRNKMGNAVLTFFTNLLFGVKIEDSQSGMWIFKRDIIPLLKLTSDGMPLSEEIKIEAFKKFRSKEVPSSYKKRVGKVKLRPYNDGVKNLMFLFKKKLFLS
tara:strand:+ start:331 stop:1014 length:684 start_codon:yes stop_codon:yes gene_type:complete